MAKNKIAQGFAYVVSALFFLYALYAAGVNISRYVTQLKQLHWPVVTATMMEENRREEQHGSDTNIVYDSYYEYHYEGIRYTGRLIGGSKKYTIGAVLKVKCNPNAPEESTTILEPQTADLLAHLALCILYAYLGSLVSGFPYNLMKKKKKRKKKKETL